MKRRQVDVRRDREQQRAADFGAGMKAAQIEMAPLLMRRFFVRGMLAGCVLTVAFGYVLRWLL